MKTTYLLLIFSFLFFSACFSTKEKIVTGKKIIVYGHLDSLPDGFMYLTDSRWKVLDSNKIEDGNFLLSTNKTEEPLMYKLTAVDNNGIKYQFAYPTNLKVNGHKNRLGEFMGDDSIKIEGVMKTIIPTNMTFPDNYKLVYPSIPMVTGRQTDVMFNVKINFQNMNADSLYRDIANAIRKYDYSYFLLYQLNENRQLFTGTQINQLLTLFSNEIQKSPTAAELKKSLNSRKDRAMETNYFETQAGDSAKINLAPYKLNMIILWASWCAPCRQEIPDLKELNKDFSGSKNFQMISISIDEMREQWLKAEKAESMPWQQLRLPSAQHKYQYEIFTFNGTIPTVLFLDNTGKIVDRTEGNNGEGQKEIFRKMILKHL